MLFFSFKTVEDNVLYLNVKVLCGLLVMQSYQPEKLLKLSIILPESKLKVSLRFAGTSIGNSWLFLWFCFSALTGLKFPITQKLNSASKSVWEMVNTDRPSVREVIVPFWHYLQIHSLAEK